MKHLFRRIGLSLIALVLLVSFVARHNDTYTTYAEETNEWNVMDLVFDNYDDWSVSQKGNVAITNSIVQNDDYITVKTNETLTDQTKSDSRYYFLVSPSSLIFPTEDDIAVEFEARVPEGYAYAEGNEVSIRAAGATSDQGRIAKIFLNSETDDKAAHISVRSTEGSHEFDVDVTQWNTYRFVITERDALGNRSFSVYVNDVKAFEGLNAPTMKGADLIRIGHDNNSSSNMDVRTMKVKANIQMITEAKLNQSVLSTNGGTLSLTINGLGIDSEYPISIELLNKQNEKVEAFETVETSVHSSKETKAIEIPEGLPEGAYRFKITAEDTEVYTTIFNITSNTTEPTFPFFEFVDEPVLKEDHIYNSTLNPSASPVEFNFPSIIDTHKTYQPDNGLIDEEGVPFRYYLFYAPHDDPGGISMMMAQDLNGPWTEYEANPFVENRWIDDEGNDIYRVPHVSSPDIFWNEDEQLFFLYFHGNNTQTRFATSPDLVTWTYGDIAVIAKDFSSIGNEASYARVYEHTIEGLNNKYVMLIMVNDTTNVRKIHYAYSDDGRNWTAVREPLADPLNAPEGIDYSSGGFNGPAGNGNMSGANLSGPYLWKWQGRTFLICHGSNGDIMAIEIGENFDKEVHWGILYDSVSGNPDLGRSGAAFMIQDDSDTWHMFYEGGSRLENNIMHAVEKGDFTVTKNVIGEGRINLSSTTLYSGARLDVSFEAKDGYELTDVLINDSSVFDDLSDNTLTLLDVDESIDVKAIFTEVSEEYELPEFVSVPSVVNVGDIFILDVLNNDQVLGQGWSWNTDLLKMTVEDAVSFTALKAGKATVTYTNTHGDSINAVIEIKEKETPKPEAPRFKDVPAEIIVGEPFVLEVENDDRHGSDGWLWDEVYFSATFNSPATFTPLKAGTTTITYTNSYNETISLSIVIKEKKIEDKDDNTNPKDENNKDKETLPKTGVQSTIQFGFIAIIAGLFIATRRFKKE